MNAEASADPFEGPRTCFAELVGWLEGTEAACLTHAELEDQLDARGRELLRLLYQGQLDMRALRERRARVTDVEGCPPRCGGDWPRWSTRNRLRRGRGVPLGLPAP